MKKLAIMQPYLFPYLGYFQVMNAVDEYVIYDDVNFIKGGWINRNSLLVNGKPTLFSAALTQASPHKLINEITIQDDFKKILKTISLAYGRAPYYEPVYELVSRICNFQDKNLAAFITNSFREIAAYLDIATKLIVSSTLDKDNSLRAQDKVIHICERLQATTYINAIGGVELYDKTAFTEHGIELYFLKTNVVTYEQYGKDFVPNLSIIDVLMFNSKESIRQMLEEYVLV